MSIETLIIEGLYLMLVGMGFVISFLTILVMILGIVEKVIPAETTAETTVSDTKLGNNTLFAVISAAIHQHRNR